jgi:hypothetical protein
MHAWAMRHFAKDGIPLNQQADSHCHSLRQIDSGPAIQILWPLHVSALPLLLPNSPQQPNAPSRLTMCDNQLGIPPFNPFTLVSTTSGCVNLCNSLNEPD